MSFYRNKYFNLFYFLISFVVLLLIYFSAYRAMLIDDGLSGIWEIRGGGWKGYLSSYGFENFYYGHYAIVALLYGVCGLHPFPWFVFFVAMHALNANLIRMVFTKIFSRTTLAANADVMGICSSLLFLLSPYQSENIIWAATSHYAISLFLLLLLLWMLVRKMESQKTLPIYVWHILFVFSLLTLEISFLFPLIMAGLWWHYAVSGANAISFRHYLLWVALPQFLFIVLYLVFHQLIYHSWLPHDRALHGTPYSFSHAVITVSQQMVKLFGFVHFFNYPIRETIYTTLNHWKIVLLFSTLISVMLFFFLYKKGKVQLVTGLFLAACGLLLYVPFMRLFFMVLHRLENDRYNYFASVFLFAFFVYILFFLGKTLRYLLIGMYLSAFLLCLFPVVSARKHSARLHQNYLAQLRADTVKGKIFLLNVPSVCRDAYVFRADYRLGIAMQSFYNQDVFDRLVQVAWYNAQHENDHFTVSKMSDSVYRVERKTPGVWWMYQSIGAMDRENEYFRFSLNEWGDYLLVFKKVPAANDQILLYDQGKFIKIN